MATREIKTTLAVDGEAQFKEALKGAYSEMKVLGSELKLGTAEFKASGDAQEYMRVRSETLRKEIEQQQKIIAALQQAVTDATTKYGEGSPKVDEYRAKLNNAQATLANMNAQLSNAEKGLDDSGRALGDTGEKTDELKEKSDNLSTTLKTKLVADGLKSFNDGLANVVSKIKDTLLAIWDLAKGAGEFADTLATTSIQTGISTKSLQEWSYAARFVDTEVSTVSSSMVKMIRAMTSTSAETQAAFTTLKVSVTDSGGALRDSETVFWECIDALGEIDNATQRDSVAMQIFGKSAQDLNPLIVAGAETWKAYCDEAQAAGLVLSEDAVGSLGQFDDSMQKIDATVSALKNNFVAAFMPALQVVADALLSIGQKVSAWLQTDEAQAKISEITGKVVSLADGLGNDLSGVIDTIISVVTGAMDIISWLISNGEVLVKVIETAAVVIGVLKIAQLALNVAMLANPIGLVVAGIGAAITAVAALIIWFGDASTAVEDWGKSIVAFDSTLSSTKANIVDMNSVLSSHGQTLSDLENGIKESESEITRILKEALGQQRALRDDELKSIEEHNDKIAALQAEKLQLYQEQMAAEIVKVNQSIETLTQQQAAQRIKNMEAYISDANEMADKAYSAQITIIDNKYRAMGELGSKAHAEELNAATAYYEKSLSDNNGYLTQLMSDLTRAAQEWVGSDAEKWAKLNDGTKRGKDEYSKILTSLSADNAEAFLTMYADTVRLGGEISEENRQLAADILGSFDNLPKKLKDQGKEALLGLTEGMRDQIPELENASDMSAQEIVDTVTNALDIHSPSRVLYDIGQNVSEGLRQGIVDGEGALSDSARQTVDAVRSTVDDTLSDTSSIGESFVFGLWEGISSSYKWIRDKITGWVDDVMGFIKGLFGIHSPSSLFRDEIGFQLGAGTALGIEDSTRQVKAAMANMHAAIDPARAGAINMGMTVEMSAPSYKRIQMAVADGMSSVNGGTIVLQVNDRELARVVRGYA